MSDLVGDKFTDGDWDGFSDLVWVPRGQRIGTGFEIRPALARMGFATGDGRHEMGSPLYWGDPLCVFHQSVTGQQTP